MEERKTSVFENGLIWFGAGVSIAEILTGTYIGGLGFRKGFLAILLGHVIGCVLLFFAGYIGAQARKSAMETTKMSFGSKGGLWFAAMNILQLVGWTAIMIYDGALTANAIFKTGHWLWALVIGGLILVWILIGITNLGKINTITMAALFILSIVLCVVIFRGRGTAAGGDPISFGAAVELAVSMPLSWMPLISDYTRTAEKPFAATMVSTVSYGLVSTWMFMIGMGAAIFAGTTDLASIMLKAGLGVAGLLIIILSTVTTTFLDAYSAGISCESISRKIDGKKAALLITVAGTVLAIFLPMDDITNFLYLIGSVFAPMIAILIADYFLLKKDRSGQAFSWVSLAVWLIGFILYRLLLKVDLPCGSTFPDMVLTMALAWIAGKISDVNPPEAAEKRGRS